MLDFTNVTKRYSDGNISLENINFHIDEGEFVFIVGSSGAGKSTLVKLILNVEKPSEGQIIFNNINVSKLKGNKLAFMRRQMGVVFQDFKLLQQKNVYENVSFVLEVARESKVNIRKKVKEVLELVGLEDKGKKFPSELSGGEQQRVAIARALVNDPLLLIADEPTGNLDSDNAWDTFQLINKVNNWGTTVVVVTHDNEIVDSMRKRVIRLEKGHVIRDSIGKYSDYHHGVEEEELTSYNSDKYPDHGESEADFHKRKEQEKLILIEDSDITISPQVVYNKESQIPNLKDIPNQAEKKIKKKNKNIMNTENNLDRDNKDLDIQPILNEEENVHAKFSNLKKKLIKFGDKDIDDNE